MKVSSLLRGVAAAAMVVAGTAQASVITTDQWYFFGFGDTGSPLTGSTAAGGQTGSITGVNTSDGSWNITLTSVSEIFWTDLQISGDRFRFYANGIEIGESGADVPGGSTTGTCISCALADSNYGKGSAILGPGSYTITGDFLGVITFGSGAFIVRDATVPAPATTALVGLALAGLALLSRRRA